MSRDAYCSSCGTPYADTAPYPRECAACGDLVWTNPKPVAVVLVPVVVADRTGLLVIRRAIPPVGGLALAGGFVDGDETWQQAGAREVYEEASLVVDSTAIEPLWFSSTTPNPNLVLLFGVTPPVAASDLPPFTPNSEVSERGVAFGPRGLVFPLHETAAQMYFGVDGPAEFTPL
ncbi:NUDIX domain-containing protein [Kibdelosporangium phytohabitans]|uniref:Nudix hydrolase domain-containing protein n=1 Tax=Kibdelosporangium phytohabitans TaxID=860235 RepID=A0A0N9I9E5_9PSEU|nr:NUDIX domain-containing protein [Kibdelosporangium phytohabitans]ALG11261.1 hypothetical protein AOZ06_34205 [Kibdelosporangium phytohabitans]MBE1462549.1 8-oxo-dGTP pyrophosphatase MutT (NUDIX family) [Kibdelosporangium phytohabitans]